MLFSHESKALNMGIAELEPRQPPLRSAPVNIKHVILGAPWPSPPRTLYSAEPVFTKQELVSYTQSCISVYETFITSYITYSYWIDDLSSNWLYF
jgi:hypothetical protein